MSPEMPSPLASAVDLTLLRVGDRARYLGTTLADEDVALLEALGLTEASELRVCHVGDPWIVQVRTTRIGIAEAVARAILVEPEAEARP